MEVFARRRSDSGFDRKSSRETVEVIRADRLSGTVANVFDLQESYPSRSYVRWRRKVRDRELHLDKQKRPRRSRAYQLGWSDMIRCFQSGLHDMDGAKPISRWAHVLQTPPGPPTLSYSAMGNAASGARMVCRMTSSDLDDGAGRLPTSAGAQLAEPLANVVSGYTKQNQCVHANTIMSAHQQRNRAIETHAESGFAFRIPSRLCMFRCEQSILRTHFQCSDQSRYRRENRHAWVAR